MATIDSHGTFTSLKNFLYACFDKAKEKSYPIFPYGIQKSTPLNSAPYVIDWSRFIEIFGKQGLRSRQADYLSESIKELNIHGIDIYFILVGGSFTNINNKSPRDMDCIMFYRINIAEEECVSLLQDTQKRLKERTVDARLIPGDSDPIIFAKSISFFTLLFSQYKDNKDSRSLLLVEPPDLQE